MSARRVLAAAVVAVAVAGCAQAASGSGGAGGSRRRPGWSREVGWPFSLEVRGRDTVVTVSGNRVVALDSAIILHPRTWEASGHLEGFTDPLVQCLGECKNRWREDHLREQQPEGELRCPECGGELGEPRRFNLMFKTHVGPVEDSGSTVYLRPETAQGIFLNFKNGTAYHGNSVFGAVHLAYGKSRCQKVGASKKSVSDHLFPPNT